MGLFTGLKRADLDRAISQVELRVINNVKSLLGNKVDKEVLNRSALGTELLAKKLGFVWHPGIKDWAPVKEVEKFFSENEKKSKIHSCEVVIEGQGGNPEQVAKDIMNALSNVFGGASVKVKAPTKSNGKKVK